MEEQKIKQAIQQQLETTEMNPYLKNKTMDYIARKSRRANYRYQQIKKVSLTAMTFATMMLVVIMQNKGDSTSQPEYLTDNLPMTLSLNDSDERNRAVMTETPFSQFKTQLNELEITYEEEAAFILEGTTIYSLSIDSVMGYYLDLSADAKNEETCSVINNILEQTNHTSDTYQIFLIDDQNFFLYPRGNEELLELLQELSTELICSKEI